jgi:hypothetical protein
MMPISNKTLAALTLVLVATAASAQFYPPTYSYVNITTNTRTIVKDGSGILHGVVVNTAGTASSVTLYDNNIDQGGKIATINTSTLASPAVLDIAFANGLTAVTAGITPADITISYN